MAFRNPEDDPPDGSAAGRALTLKYHSDIQLVHHPRIYRGNKRPSELMDSRRVIFYNLPACFAPLQVARVAAAFGQVLLVEGITDICQVAGQHGTMSMLVEFVSPYSASICSAAANSTRRIFIDESGQQYVGGVWVIPTLSFPIPPDISSCLHEGRTRTITCQPIAEKCVWFVVSAIALPRDVLDAEYDGSSETLTVEFASVNVANTAITDLRCGLFNFLFEEESSQRQFLPCQDRIADEGTMTYLDPDRLRTKFDCAPYNSYWPNTYYYIMVIRNLRPRFNEPSDTSSSSTAVNTDDEGLSGNSTSVDEDANRCGRPRRTPSGESASSKMPQKQFMELLDTGIEDPGMSGDWDSFFQNRETISLKAWANYGDVARHRRELSIEQGLAAGVLPKCDGTCSLGCKDIRKTARPKEVDKYLSESSDDLLIEY